MKKPLLVNRYAFLRTSIAAFVLLLPGCTAEAPPAPSAPVSSANHAVEPLLQLMRDRLLIMHDVAKAKWNARLPISDPAREQALIAELVASTKPSGIDPEILKSFLTAQIEAGKRIQQADFDAWQATNQGPFPDAPDLRTVIRPQIDRLSRNMVERFAAIASQLDEPEFQAALDHLAPKVITGPGIDAAVRETALAPLNVERPLSNPLDGARTPKAERLQSTR